MLPISGDTIRNLASSDSVYQRGDSLFSTDGVMHIDLDKISEERYDVSAQVEGSTGNLYYTGIMLKPIGNTMIVKEMYCECRAYSKYPGACKHLIATMFEYNYQFEHVSEPSESDYSPDSDEELKNLLDYFVLQDRNQFCQEYGHGDVRLVPILHLEPDRESLELKIGTTQLYVVKDIRELVENIKQMRYVSYGKKLAFTHSQSAFTRDSIGIVNLLLELDDENEYSYRYHGYGYSNVQMRRSCTLSPAMLDILLELYEGKTMHVDDQFLHEEQDVPIVRENPRLPVRIHGIQPYKNGARLEMDPIFMAEGSRQWYILWNHCFYICTKAYYEQVKSFLKLMSQERSQSKGNSYYGRYAHTSSSWKKPSFYLSEQDFGTFSKNVLPIISDVLHVTVTDLDFTSYEPQKAAFRSYLDKVGDHIECKTLVLYGDEEYNVANIPAKEESSRDIRQEFRVRVILEQYFELASDQQTYYSKQEETILSFLETGMRELESVSEVFATDRFKRMRVVPMPPVTTGISIKGNLLDLSWNVEGMSAQDVMEILADYRKKKKYHKLKTGEFLRLDENSLAVLAELNDGLHLTKEQLKERKAEVPLYRSLYLDSIMKENSEYIRMERDKKFKTIVREMRSAEDGEYEIPEQITALLRPYQEIGFQWLCTLAKYGFGGILADDMGLGKTLQVLTFLAAHPNSRTLVVCPSSLIYNWEEECCRFYPGARIASIAGSAASRQIQIEQFEEYDIIITSYDLLKRDIDYYENKYFDYMMIDEAQYIKNTSTQAAKSVKSISCGCRFALTGTPIENRLSELWSIFEYLMPGYLFSYKRFKEELESPIAESQDDAARIRLSRLVRPFILRRLKKDVLKELPDKIEEVVYARMDGEQQRLYQAREKQLVIMLSKQTDEEFKTQKLQILAELTALRQICCDPALVYENYGDDSAKTKTCIEVIQNAVSGGHKILLFSQFSSMLERLHMLLEEQEIRTLILTGKTKKEERRRLVAQFQSERADVFLISLKAGGTGLNLTAADMVIHYDPWWNLAAQNQATDRAYRIGQDNKVTVLRLIMKGTIEERILKMQQDKQNLADSIISEDGVSMSGLDKEQLIAVLEAQDS
ncbi:MAG: ATP-dependent helicase [Eubacterium sp.]|nr:ATP-dependent helicase [Eubacterium sp.]